MLDVPSSMDIPQHEMDKILAVAQKLAKCTTVTVEKGENKRAWGISIRRMGNEPHSMGVTLKYIIVTQRCRGASHEGITAWRKIKHRG